MSSNVMKTNILMSSPAPGSNHRQIKIRLVDIDWVYIRSNHLEKVFATKLKNHIVDMLVESKAQYERAKSKKPPPPRPKTKPWAYKKEV